MRMEMEFCIDSYCEIVFCSHWSSHLSPYFEVAGLAERETCRQTTRTFDLTLVERWADSQFIGQIRSEIEVINAEVALALKTPFFNTFVDVFSMFCFGLARTNRDRTIVVWRQRNIYWGGSSVEVRSVACVFFTLAASFCFFSKRSWT